MSSFKSAHIHMKDAQCAETNEKSNFRFLVFEICLEHLIKKIIPKYEQCSETDF